ncbi:hypothetical protein G6F31_017880 [Rhizopus arrhizus]|nr:hypothetical protein G6F31_017880 [Rhizopus arrhizus]
MPDALGNGLAERGVDRLQDRTAVHLGQGTVVALRPGADPRPPHATPSERQQQLPQDAAGVGQPAASMLSLMANGTPYSGRRARSPPAASRSSCSPSSCSSSVSRSTRRIQALAAGSSGVAA